MPQVFKVKGSKVKVTWQMPTNCQNTERKSGLPNPKEVAEAWN